MRVLITSFLVLFGIMELSHWIKHFTLPLPILILGGALLAIASNHNKSPGWSFLQQQGESDTHPTKTPKIETTTPTINQTNLNPTSSTPLPQRDRSISFTIRRTSQE